MGKRILLSRTDSIGDVVLSLPMAHYVKQQLPDATLIFLGTDYTRAVIEACRHIDRFEDWTAISTLSPAERAARLRALEIDAFVHVFPRIEIATAARRAGIPLRVGVRRRWFHLLTCNRLPNLSRRGSSLHEAQLDLRLLEPLGIRVEPSLDELGGSYGIEARATLPPEVEGKIDPARFNLILHPSSQGSAVEWPLEHYAQLVRRLDKRRFQVFVTGTARDRAAIGAALPLDPEGVVDLCGRLGLAELLSFIDRVDGLVAASTGPLHIAAALGKRAIGLYTPRRPIHPGRWAPLGPRALALVDDEACEACASGRPCDCITRISPERVARILEGDAAGLDRLTSITSDKMDYVK